MFKYVLIKCRFRVTYPLELCILYIRPPICFFTYLPTVDFPEHPSGLKTQYMRLRGTNERITLKGIVTNLYSTNLSSGGLLRSRSGPLVTEGAYLGLCLLLHLPSVSFRYQHRTTGRRRVIQSSYNTFHAWSPPPTVLTGRTSQPYNPQAFKSLISFPLRSSTLSFR